jgi:hypothetical protein
MRRPTRSPDAAMSLDVATFVHDAFLAGFGWRYLLSSSFRQKLHAAWKVMPKRDVLDEVAILVVSFLFANAVLIAALVAWLK